QAAAGQDALSGNRRPERWRASSGERDVVRLDIPADALHERAFEIFVHLVVANRAARTDATHALRVLVDGALEWQRSAPSHTDGGDSLELRLRRVVPAGRPLRLNATCELKGSQRVSLTITADEA
ncbi:MAG: hypothetical protein ABUL50_08370, partial [Rhizobacter sp.]